MRINFGQLTVDQIELTVTGPTPDAPIVPPTRRPETPSGELGAPQTVAIYLPDALDGNFVMCTAAGLEAGARLDSTGAAVALVRRGALVAVDLTLDRARANGVTCVGDVECVSGLCVDGVCCSSTCGLCQACDVPGSEGTCASLGPGAPSQACAEQPAATCGFDGTCDGQGGCRRHPLGVACAAASCQDGRLIPAAACDGHGTCVPAAALFCEPFTCDETAAVARCRATCLMDAECVAGNACVNGSCGVRPKQPNGVGCLAADDCASGNCVEGVCCDSACNGVCMSCSSPSMPGTCRPVAAGRGDPRGRCADQGAASCGGNGLCDGSGTCALYPADTLCLAGTCGGGHVIRNPSRCDGRGNCLAATDIDCAPYKCDRTTTVCFRACADNTACATGAGAHCDVDAGTCM